MTAIARTLFPHRCVGCGREGNVICGQCLSETNARISGVFRCPACGRDSPFGAACGCRGTALDGVVAMAHYGNPVLRALLHEYKFCGVEEAGAALRTLFGSFLRSRRGGILTTAPRGIVPVPNHLLRRATRGFDHVAPFARIAGLALDLPVHGALRAKFRMKRQSSFASGEGRRRNASGGFSLGRGVRLSGGMILIDDVCTSGATLAECAAALKSGGADRVWGITLLRG